ncbi:HK97 gp10 family phage protein [Streptomyces capuensis]|uniref:HK97 gp10 family phage protein n=1 Tax=Streptomyces capuensis TaxID=1464056 RepID=UPI0004BF1821|nr:HK97 gp10 family phage protein [Streptomyces capuensis]
MTPDELAVRLEQAAGQVHLRLEAAVRHAGQLGQARIQGNASGRPGPNVITGAYRSSWRTEMRFVPGGAECTIGTNAPQARRLEFGFTGADSLGRVYAQPPFPQVQPALD